MFPAWRRSRAAAYLQKDAGLGIFQTSTYRACINQRPTIATVVTLDDRMLRAFHAADLGRRRVVASGVTLTQPHAAHRCQLWCMMHRVHTSEWRLSKRRVFKLSVSQTLEVGGGGRQSSNLPAADVSRWVAAMTRVIVCCSKLLPASWVSAADASSLFRESFHRFCLLPEIYVITRTRGQRRQQIRAADSSMQHLCSNTEMESEARWDDKEDRG